MDIKPGLPTLRGFGRAHRTANLRLRPVADVVGADQFLALLSVFDSARLFGEGQLQRMVQIFLRIRFGDYR
jgi:hypothetical protein